MVEGLGRTLDRLVGIFSPTAEMKRTAARLIMRQYAAAKTTRLTGNWNPVNENVNRVISSSSVPVRSRVRQLVRDFPYFARAVNVLVDFTVGPGIILQSRVKDAGGKLDKVLCQKIEDAFLWWMDEADISGKLHFYDLMRLAKRQDVEVGEFLLVRVKSSDKNRFLPYALQIYEADWLTSSSDTYYGSGTVTAGGKKTVTWQGIEYDLGTGEIVAYHFADPDSWGGKTKRIPARDVIHGFDSQRPNQLRGISPFAPAVLVAHDLGDYMDAEMDGAKMAAKWLAFVESGDIAQFQDLRRAENQENSKQLEDLENALIEYLKPGEKVTLASHNRPGDAFEPFTRLILRMVSVSIGISYELLSGDYQGLNYSVLRGIRNDLIKQFVPLQKRHERQFCRPIFRDFLEWAVTAGKLYLPDYWANTGRFLRTQWIPPGMPAVDPLKEGRANADAIKAMLKSPQETAAERGRDLEEIYDEILAAEEMRRERRLEPPASVSKSTNTNPASLDDEKDDEQKSDTQSGGSSLIPFPLR